MFGSEAGSPSSLSSPASSTGVNWTSGPGGRGSAVLPVIIVQIKKGETSVFVCTRQGAHGDVRSDEDLRTHLREALVAGPVQDRLQDLR